MNERQPVVQTISVTDVRQHLGKLLNKVYRRETRVIIEKSGIPVAALVSVDDLARLDQLDRAWDEGTNVLERFSAAFSDVPIDELEVRIDAIIAAGREQDEAGRQTA